MAFTPITPGCLHALSSQHVDTLVLPFLVYEPSRRLQPRRFGVSSQTRMLRNRMERHCIVTVSDGTQYNCTIRRARPVICSFRTERRADGWTADDHNG